MRYVPLSHVLALAYYSLRFYCRAFVANYHAVLREYQIHHYQFPRLRTLRDLCNGADNPFLLSDLAVYYLRENDPAQYGL